MAAVLAALTVTTLIAVRSGDARTVVRLERVEEPWITGMLGLGDDDVAEAVLLAGGDPARPPLLTPVRRCITVTYDGRWTRNNSEIRVYGTAVGPLAPHLALVVERGTGDTPVDCTGTFVPEETVFTGPLAQFAEHSSSYPTGVAGWRPSESPQSVVYRISIRRATPAPPEAGVVARFVWEAQTL